LPFINTKNLRIYYQSEGQGDNLLYISGTGGDLRKSPTPFDNDLKNNFRLTAYDQRGLGQTEATQGPYSMQDYAEDACYLLNQLDLKRSYVIGVSFGGMVAQHLAINYPDMVTKLVLMCTSPGGEKYHSYPLHELEEIKNDIEYAKKFISISDLRIDENFKKIDGVSLKPIIEGRTMVEKIAFSETGNPLDSNTPPKKPNTKSVRTSKWKLIYNEYNDSKELYDLENDPDENENLIGTGLEIEKVLWTELVRIQNGD